MKFALALLALASGATALKLPSVPQRSRVRTARVRAPVVQALPVGVTHSSA